MRHFLLAIPLAAAVLAACSQPTQFDPEDPVVVAQIDSLVQSAVEGAREADANRVLAIAGSDEDLTFITGDVMLMGLETIRAAFENTYASVDHQDQAVLEKHIRLLTPDVAIVTAISEGTYTDIAGWTSDPVGMGHTLVFVRENGQWRLRHAHQSIAF